MGPKPLAQAGRGVKAQVLRSLTRRPLVEVAGRKVDTREPSPYPPSCHGPRLPDEALVGREGGSDLMARLVGFIGNRPDLAARAIELEQRALLVRLPETSPPGWGVGFYQGGEVLLRRRPIDERTELSLVELTRDLRGDVVLVHVRDATVGAHRTENTHPFRYRQWLYAQTGTVHAFASLRQRLLESLPEFLQRDVRGETDSELVFHLFLSFLHDAGVLDRPDVTPEVAAEALRSTHALLDRLCAEEGQAPTSMNLMLSTPEYLIGLRRGAPMALRVFEGPGDIEQLFGQEGLSRMRLPDLASCRGQLLASDFGAEGPPPNWELVPSDTLVSLSRADARSMQRL